jgi:hypothetical protein
MVNNPFEVTKAVDFTDAQIAATWVDLPGGGFFHLADPRSPMPRFLVGGKGGGRTHLLRYFSHPLQRLRNDGSLLKAIQNEKYVGIYFHCAGLNSSRFAKKGKDSEAWAAIFSYYTEIWFGRLAVNVIEELFEEASLDDRSAEVKAFVNAVTKLFDIPVLLQPENETLLGLSEHFHATQRQLDIAINNAALTHELDIKIGASPGRLVFGVPAAATQFLSTFSEVVFAFLVDEYENLTVDQQRYVNTLIREKQRPTTFLVGSRLYGLRTHETLSAGETNRQGSEYDLVVLESTYRSKVHDYKTFCTNLVKKRLEKYGGQFSLDLSACFQEPVGSLEERAAQYVEENLTEGARPPWIGRLQEQLQSAGLGAKTSEVLAQVRFPESPLHEKFAILLLYRSWADGKNPSSEAVLCRQAVERLMKGDINSNDDSKKISTAYNHQRKDLFAQILKSLAISQEYFGFDDFVPMSGFLPRNLIVLLKQITRWSLFLGEQPFAGQGISLNAQLEGVREASAWFFSEAKGLGQVGDDTQRAIRRLGGLFRDMRFSDKPVEVGCSTFTTDRQGLTRSAILVLDAAIAHSLILEVPNGRREKNTGTVQHKYQLNPMLAPLFDLSLARRGQASLSAAELNGIFDPSVSDSTFGAVKEILLARMSAPFRVESLLQGSLFE